MCNADSYKTVAPGCVTSLPHGPAMLWLSVEEKEPAFAARIFVGADEPVKGAASRPLKVYEPLIDVRVTTCAAPASQSVTVAPPRETVKIMPLPVPSC